MFLPNIPVRARLMVNDLIYRSGTEEQYTDVHQLLDDIQSYIDDMQQTKNNKKKEEEDKKKGIELRDKAMETLKRSKLSIFEIFCDNYTVCNDFNNCLILISPESSTSTNSDSNSDEKGSQSCSKFLLIVLNTQKYVDKFSLYTLYIIIPKQFATFFSL